MQKKIPSLILLTIAALFAGHSTQAQAYYGFKAGYNQTWLQTDVSNISFTKLRSGPGYSVEIPFRVDVTKKFYVESGLNFINKSHSIVRTGAYTGSEIRYTNTYLQLPVKLGAHFKLNKLGFFINAGVGASWWASGKVKGSSPNIFNFTSTVSNNGQITDNFHLDNYSERYQFNAEKDNRFEFGWSAGAGLQFPLKKTRYVFAELNYYQSLTDQQKKYMAMQNPRYYKTYSVSIGYLIPLRANR
ncbi:MAG: porin family protein [Chitinophagaceae bacterium]